MAERGKNMVWIVVSFILVAAMYSSFISDGLARQNSPKITCQATNTDKSHVTCCWLDNGKQYCLDCVKNETGSGWSCGDVYPCSTDVAGCPFEMRTTTTNPPTSVLPPGGGGNTGPIIKVPS